VPIRLESELLDPVTTWLQAAGFDVRFEVPILSHRADMVGSRGRALTAIELKLHQWPKAIRQAVAYQLAVDRAWVAMPLAAAGRAYRERWIFESEGVGLLAVDDRARVRCPIPARQSPRLLPFVREKVLEGMHARLTPLEPSIEGHGPWILSLISPEFHAIRKASLKVHEQVAASP
jgi:hypothetical protein